MYQLDISSKEATDIYSKGEYDGTIVLTKEEFISYTKPEIPSITIYKNFIEEILN